MSEKTVASRHVPAPISNPAEPTAQAATTRTVSRRARFGRWCCALVLVMSACQNGSSPADPMGAEPGSSGCGPYPDASTSPYVLPYPVGRTYTVIQGNCTSRSHAVGTRRTYAYDFDLQIGDPIIAARAGQVAGIVQHYPDSTRVRGEENYVDVLHDDGTLARYIHLTTNGARVRSGERVEQGQVIAISGDSGWSALPHLHFDVFACSTCDRSIPVTFRNTDPHPNGLVEGLAYTAGVH